MGLGIVCSPRGEVKCFSSAVESKVRTAIPDMTPMFLCNTCTEFLGVFYYSAIVNTDTFPSKLALQVQKP